MSQEATRVLSGDHGLLFEPVDPTRVGEVTGNAFLSAWLPGSRPR